MKGKNEKVLIHRCRNRKYHAFRRSVACVTSNITIVCIVLGYIVGGGFLFRYLEAEAEYNRLKSGNDKVNKYKEKFINENKDQIQIYKSKLMEQTKKYFSKLNGAVDSISYMGRTPGGKTKILESNGLQQIIHLVKNMSFLHIESDIQPTLRTFNKSNKRIMDKFIEEIYNTTMNGFIIDFKENNTTLWTLSGSILYSVTVITTIGYGNIVPKTDSGKIATIIYAMFGIPLMLLCLASLGAFFADLFRLLYSCFLKHCQCKKLKCKKRKRSYLLTNGKKLTQKEDKKFVTTPNRNNTGKDSTMTFSQITAISKVTDSPSKKEKMLDSTISIDSTDFIDYLAEEPVENDLPVTFALIIFIIYILVGALFIKYYEDWEYLNCVYFVFITFSTIGFGDFVPGSLNYQWSNQVAPILCALYLLLGLVFLSMCFQLIQDSLRKRATKMGKRIGLLNTRGTIR